MGDVRWFSDVISGKNCTSNLVGEFYLFLKNYNQ